MPTPKAFGLSDSAFHDLESALVKAGGHTFDIVRTYAVPGDWQGQDPKPQAAAGYRVVASIKPKGLALADVASGKADSQLVPMYDYLLGLSAPRTGHHLFVPFHEPDTFFAKGGTGTPADLDAAIAHMLTTFTGRPGYAGSAWDVGLTLTGYQYGQRIVDYPKAVACVLARGDRGVLGLDQPYGTGASPEENVGGAVDYIAAHYPHARVQIHECGRVPTAVNGSGRAQWLAAFSAALMSSRYDQVDAVVYWNSGPYVIDPASPDVAALAAFQKAIVTLPTTQVKNVALAELDAATSAVTAASSQYQLALSRLQSAVASLR